MLVVRAEIWPSGDQRRAELIGSISAENISELAEISSYLIRIDQVGDGASGARTWDAVFELTGHRRADGVWMLVKSAIERILTQMGGPNPPHDLEKDNLRAAT